MKTSDLITLLSIGIWVGVTGGLWSLWYFLDGDFVYVWPLVCLSLVAVAVVVGGISDWFKSLFQARNELDAIHKFNRAQDRIGRPVDSAGDRHGEPARRSVVDAHRGVRPEDFTACNDE